MTDKPVLVPDENHPITVRPAGERVLVTVGDTVVADTTQALTLREAGYPAVPYVPLSDVNTALLQRTEHATYCPFKGSASYFDLTVGGRTHENAVWTYESPYPAVADIAGHVAFYPDAVEVRTTPPS